MSAARARCRGPQVAASGDPPPGTGTGLVDVTYRYVEPLTMWLPERMIEVFEATARNAWERLEGRADYSNYRQFQTTARIK
jgi:hypothetical protein